MSTRAELIARIKSDIADITTPRGIKKPKVASILTDLVNLATPSVDSGGNTQVFEIGGNPVYRKLIFEPDGNNLSNLDLTLPANAQIVSFNTFVGKRKNLTISHTKYVLRNTKSFEIYSPTFGIFGSPEYSEIPFADIDFRLTFSDASTEESSMEIINHAVTAPYIIQKDLAGETNIIIEVLPTSRFAKDSGFLDLVDFSDFNGKTSNCIAVNTIEFPGDGGFSALSSETILSNSEITTLENLIMNNNQYKNIYAILDYIILP